MKKTVTFLFILTICFLFSCKKNQEIKILSEDIFINESVSFMDLSGYKLVVNKQGIVLERIENGLIEISEEVGAGTVFLRNCKNIDLTVHSKASIILEGQVSIHTLEIKDNARIVSRNQIEEKYKKKKNSFLKKTEEKGTANINETFVDSNLKPVLEGGSYYSIVKRENSAIVLKSEELAVVHEIIEEKKKISLSKDETYTGCGVKLNIADYPDDADYVSVTVSDGKNQIVEDITELTNSWLNENLLKNIEYEITFQYFKKLPENETSDLAVLCGASSIKVKADKEKFTGIHQGGVYISDDYILRVENENLLLHKPENVTGFSVDVIGKNRNSFCRIEGTDKILEFDLKPYLYSNWDVCEEAELQEFFNLRLNWLVNNISTHEYFFMGEKILSVDNIPFVQIPDYEPLRIKYEDGVVTVIQCGEKLQSAFKEIYPKYHLLVDTPNATMNHRQLNFADLFKPVDVSLYFESRSFEIEKNDGWVTVKFYITNKKQQWYMNIHPDTKIKIRE